MSIYPPESQMPCGCRIVTWDLEPFGDGARIEFCALHQAAPDLLEAAKSTIRYFEGEGGAIDLCAKVQAAIEKAEEPHK